MTFIMAVTKLFDVFSGLLFSMMRHKLIFLFLVLALIAISCKPTVQSSVATVQQLATIEKDEPIVIPTDTFNESFSGLRKKALVKSFYDSRDGKPVWVAATNGYNLLDSLVQFLEHVEYIALPSSRYHLPEIQSLNVDSGGGNEIRKELLLTDAFLLLVSDLKMGLLSSNGIPDSTRVVILDEVLEAGDLQGALHAQEPAVDGYLSLKDVLKMRLNARSNSDVDLNELQREIELISINLERWRGERDLSKRYVIVNIPSFTLDVVENDSTILTSRIIVGTPETKTPILSSTIECISIYPYWHVPRKISIEEYLPEIQKDTSFINRNNFDIIDRKGNILDPDSLPWQKFNTNYFPVVLRQREGPENALGVIKFVFDNPYAVYLHDTNAKRLFNSRKRAFSHGCVRMEKAVELAHLLVTGKTGAESKTLSTYLNEKQQRWMDLRNPMPIYIRYFTCEYRNGTLRAYDDIYSLDEELREILFPGASIAEF